MQSKEQTEQTRGAFVLPKIPAHGAYEGQYYRIRLRWDTAQKIFDIQGKTGWKPADIVAAMVDDCAARLRVVDFTQMEAGE